MTDHDWMGRAAQIAANGYPAPNPHVGCVIVKNNQLLAEGYHECTGGPHAEVNALKNAGREAKNADVYCTLEPCNHTGRTGPCSHALIQAGVKRVFYAVKDPNPKAKGGAETLREAGIEAIHLPIQEAIEVNQQFLFAMSHQRPLVIAKYAMTLDGAIATRSGESKWITSPESRTDAQKLRAQCGAVLVGRKTAELDAARLNVRDFEIQNQPLRIVLDQCERLSKDLPIFDQSAPTWHLTSKENVWQEGSLDVLSFLNQLYEKGITGLLIEGGSETLATFFKSGLVDLAVGYIGPKLFGSGLSPVSDFGVEKISQSPTFEIETVSKIGPDIKWIANSRNFSEWRASYLLQETKV